MANMGRALMSGLVQGFGKYANMQYDEKQKAEEAERDQELAKLQQKLKQESQRFEQSLKPAQYQTYEVTGKDGATMKRTVKSSYDPKNGAMEETVGESVVEPKEKRAETAIEYAQRDPEGYAKMQAMERRPTVGDSGEVSERERYRQDQLTSREELRQKAINERLARAETNKRMRELSGAIGASERADEAVRFGFDPKDKNLNDKLRTAILKENMGTYGIDAPEDRPLMESSGAPTSFPKFNGQDFAPKADIFASSSSPSPQAPTAPEKKPTDKPDKGAEKVPPEVQTLISQADKAIQGGADPDKVKARLNDMLKAKGYSLK